MKKTSTFMTYLNMLFDHNVNSGLLKKASKQVVQITAVTDNLYIFCNAILCLYMYRKKTYGGMSLSVVLILHLG